MTEPQFVQTASPRPLSTSIFDEPQFLHFNPLAIFHGDDVTVDQGANVQPTPKHFIDILIEEICLLSPHNIRVCEYIYLDSRKMKTKY